MLNKEETQKQLDKFRKYVIQQAKSNLSKSKKNSSKKLYDSINGVSKVNPNSISLYFEMLDYGIYQDKGVSGVKKKYNTPYAYKTKMPPIKSLDKWIVKKDSNCSSEELSMIITNFKNQITFKDARVVDKFVFDLNGDKKAKFYSFEKVNNSNPVCVQIN